MNGREKATSVWVTVEKRSEDSQTESLKMSRKSRKQETLAKGRVFKVAQGNLKLSAPRLHLG